MESKSILILGGARSGKSHFAQEWATRLADRVLFVATAEALDGEMRQRIEEHKRSRPQAWRTLEARTGVGQAITEGIGDAEIVIVDCLTLLVSNVLADCATTPDMSSIDCPLAEERLDTEVEGLLRAFAGAKASFIVVSNEVGLGLVPDNPLGRVYRDCLGRVNRQLAARMDEVYFMVAGIPLKLPTGPDRQWPQF